MPYTVVNDSRIVIVQGLPYVVRIAIASNKPSDIEKAILTLQFGTSKESSRDDETGLYSFFFTEEETTGMEPGNYFYSLSIVYADGTTEPNPYAGRLTVKKEPELKGDDDG